MIIYNLENVADLPEGEVHLAIGIFDGVHLGHQKLIASAIKGARESKGIAVALTFWPHPSNFFNTSSPTPTIMSAEIKNHLLEEQGLDIVVQEKFTQEFAQASPEDFIKMLKKAFPSLKAIYAGNDFHFGYKRQGDMNFLQRIGKREGFKAVKQKNILYQGEKISSTRIREELKEGNTEEANTMLGYPYFSIGLVVIPPPALSIVWNPQLRPKYGIYSVKVYAKTKKKKINGIAYYGEHRLSETGNQDIMDPNLEIYFNEPNDLGMGDALTVEWIKFLYPEPNFLNQEDFQKQIVQQIAEAKQTLIS